MHTSNSILNFPRMLEKSFISCSVEKSFWFDSRIRLKIIIESSFCFAETFSIYDLIVIITLDLIVWIWSTLSSISVESFSIKSFIIDESLFNFDLRRVMSWNAAAHHEFICSSAVPSWKVVPYCNSDRVLSKSSTFRFSDISWLNLI